MPASVSDFCAQVSAATPASGARFSTSLNPDGSVAIYRKVSAAIVTLTLLFPRVVYGVHTNSVWLKTHAWPIVLVSALNTLALFLILFRYAERSTFWFVVWFSLVCAFTLHISRKLREPENIRKMEWERLAITIFTVVFGLYATNVFPNLRHEFGGARSVPVVLHFAKKSPTFDSESVSVLLIDETEQGYNVVRGTDRAVFVSRLVEEVEFLRPTK